MRIDRIAIWIVNGLLFVAGCYLVTMIVVDTIAEAFLPEETQVAAAPPPPAPVARTWQDRQVILSRNLFGASVNAPTAPLPDPDEELEETKLPLTLLGTAAGADEATSWAAVEDREDRTHAVVRVGDVLKGRAKVLRIERRRIVLENGGKREELSLKDSEEGDSPRVARARPNRRAPARTTRASRESRSDLRERVRKLADNRFSVDRGDVEEAMRNPAELFSQARILPKYEDGQMVGVQLNSVKPGSLFADIGIESGDVITELNGISIDSPEQSAELLRELAEAAEFNVSVTGADGQDRSLNFVPQN